VRPEPRPLATALGREAADPEPQHLTYRSMRVEPFSSVVIKATLGPFFCPWNLFGPFAQPKPWVMAKSRSRGKCCDPMSFFEWSCLHSRPGFFSAELVSSERQDLAGR
jgi:hypothetical protein